MSPPTCATDLPQPDLSRNVSQRAKELAAANGFPLHGIASIPADGKTPGAEKFGAWLDGGMHGPLDYMLHGRQTRTQLHSRFPWARSILALGAFYDGSAQGEPGRDLR